jgi:hypothetical protein
MERCRLVCTQVLSVPKEFHLQWHYASLHEDKLKKYQGYARIARLEDYKEKCDNHKKKQNVKMNSKMLIPNLAARMYNILPFRRNHIALYQRQPK